MTMLNPPLLLVSALFFLALASVLYAGSWLIASAVLRLLRGRISHTAAKRVLVAALVLPPLLAFLPTLSGATLRISHDRFAPFLVSLLDIPPALHPRSLLRRLSRSRPELESQ